VRHGGASARVAACAGAQLPGHGEFSGGALRHPRSWQLTAPYDGRVDTWFWVVVLLGAAVIALVIVGAVRARSRVDPTDVSLDPALVARIRQLYGKGDKLGAVKALRAATGLGLADAIRIADKLGASAKPAPSKEHPGGSGVPPLTAAIGPDHQDEVRSLVAAGQQIEAIKMVRTLTGMGLKEATEYVERLPPG
jgi:ribosomal protein L7/L12